MNNSMLKVRGDRAVLRRVAFLPYYSGSRKPREIEFFRRLETACVRISLATNSNTDNFSNHRDKVDVCDVMAGLAVNGVPEKTGVTSFVQESCTSTAVDSGAFSKSVYPVDGEVQDVTKYFARPVALSSGNVPTSLRSRFFVYDYRFSDLISLWTNGQSRLKGVFGMRATTVFTLQVACTPFHQGLLALAFQYSSAAASTDIYSRGSNSATVTNLPHVRLDLSSDTMVQLRVPYVASQEYQTVDGNVLEFPFGHVSINAILGVAAVSGISAPAYQLYVHLEDIELFGAKPQNVVSINLNSDRKLAKEYEDDSKPLSSATHALSRTVRYIGKGIPSLSSITGPSAWFLEKAAGTIRSFGYSKVPMIEPVIRMVDQSNVGECNVDNATSLVVAGPIAANTLRVSPLFGGTDVDEMSLKFVTSSWSQICTVPINTTLTPGTLLYATPTGPMSFWFRGFTTSPAANKPSPPLSGSTGWNGILPSSLFFASQFFKYWRGSIKFRFTFAKSKMHGGRVMVAFNPSLSFTSEDVVANTAVFNVPVSEYGAGGPNPFAYSAVFNLRDGNVFEFEVPYMSPLPWTGFSSWTGTLVMYVVDALQAPSVVSSSIGCLVEVAGGDNFELANVVTARYAVANNAVALNSDRKVETTTYVAVPGGYRLFDEAFNEPLTPLPSVDVVLNSERKISNDGDIVPDLTIGESINSVKQLIMIPHATTIELLAGVNRPNLFIAPWNYIPDQTFPPAQGQFTLARGSLSTGGMWAACYAFSRGGTDIHAYARNVALNGGLPNRTDTLMAVYEVSSNGGAYREVSTFNSAPMCNNPMVYTYKNLIHAKLPWFSPLVRAPSWGANAITKSWDYVLAQTPNGTTSTLINSFANAYPSSLYQLAVKRISFAEIAVRVVLYRSASDDAMLSMYMGPPPIWIPYSGSPGNVYDIDTTDFRNSS